MKAVIDQKVLTHLLERGALAALSDEAQGDTTAFQKLIKSVRITVDANKVVVESATSLVASRYEMAITKDSGIEVKEDGIALVPALELSNWVSKQKRAKIALSYSALANPEIINVADDQAEFSNSKSTVRKIANLRLVSKDDSKTGSKWQIECYDPDPLPAIDFSKKPSACLSVPSGQLNEGLSNVMFSSQKKDYQHIFDSIALESYQGNVYMAASDMHRCSIYKLDKATHVDKAFFTETKSDSKGNKFGQKVLVPCSFLKMFVTNSDGSGIVNFHYDKEKSKVYVSESGWDVRLATVDGKMFDKFPTIHMLMSKGFSRLGHVPKVILSSRLTSASLVNKQTVLFDFHSDSVIIHAISEGDYSPNASNAPVRQLAKDIKVILGVQHVMDVIKVIKDDDISMLVPEDMNMNSIKVVSQEDPNLSYFAMTVKNPKYDDLMK
jgi:DNA polymerase III sliding clamp (beta) subunit (PCNA family)